MIISTLANNHAGPAERTGALILIAPVLPPQLDSHDFIIRLFALSLPCSCVSWALLRVFQTSPVILIDLYQFTQLIEKIPQFMKFQTDSTDPTRMQVYSLQYWLESYWY